MLFNYERKGNFGGREIFIFQDLIDSPRSLQEMGKMLEPYFQIFYIYLPEPIQWLNPSALVDMKLGSNVASLLEESTYKKIGIVGGMSYAYWREILGTNESKFLKFYLFHPEYNELGTFRFYFEVLKIFWDRPGYNLFDWVQAQPMAHHLSLAQNLSRKKFPYSIHLIRTDKPSKVYQQETKLLLDRFENIEWSRFAIENLDSLKISQTIKKFLLMNIAKDYGRKPESYWTDIIRQ